MDIWRITVAVLRRWYVFLPLLALTGVGAFAVGEGVQPQYEVRATVVLIPGTGESEIDNPYGGLESTTEVLSIVLDSPPLRDSIEDRGLNRDYEIETRSRSSIMDVTVLSDTKQESLATADAVLEMARKDLAERQGDVNIPTHAQVGLQTIRAPAMSEVVTEGKLRNMAIVGVAGAALSLLVAILFDDLVGLVRTRAQRRGATRVGRVEARKRGPRRERRRSTTPDQSTRRSPIDTSPSAPEVDEPAPQEDPVTSTHRKSAASHGRT